MLGRIIAVLVLTGFALSAIAQQDSSGYVPKIKKEPASFYKHKKDRLFLEPHLDRWLEVPEGIEQRTWSLGFDASFLWDIPFGNSPMSFGIGIGVSSFNVHHNGQFAENDSLNVTEFTPFPDDYEYDKNKLSLNYLELPLELRLRTKGKQPFRFTVGAKVGWLFDAHTKTKDDEGTRKFKQVANTLPYRYGVFGRVGYSWFSLVGFYSLSPVFEDGKGPELVPISFGVSITPF